MNDSDHCRSRLESAAEHRCFLQIRPQSTRSPDPRYEVIRLAAKWSPLPAAQPLRASSRSSANGDRLISEVIAGPTRVLSGSPGSRSTEHSAEPTCLCEDLLAAMRNDYVVLCVEDAGKRSALIETCPYCAWYEMAFDVIEALSRTYAWFPGVLVVIRL